MKCRLLGKVIASIAKHVPIYVFLQHTEHLHPKYAHCVHLCHCDEGRVVERVRLLPDVERAGGPQNLGPRQEFTRF